MNMIDAIVHKLLFR